MKGILFLMLLLCLTDTFSQTYINTDFPVLYENYFHKSELDNFYSLGGEIIQLTGGKFEVHYPCGLIRIFNFNTLPGNRISHAFIDSTIIDVSALDTSDYLDRFTYWKQVQITNSEFYPLLVNDLNNNGYPEIYGCTSIRPSNGFAGPVRALELNSSGSFDNLFSYDSTILVKAVGDIHGNGLESIYFHTVPDFTQSGCFYTSSDENQVPDYFDFVLNYSVPNIGFQINDMTFGDFNKNGLSDCAFDCWSYQSSFVICEYDSAVNNFNPVFSLDTTVGSNLSGLCVDDFDEDGMDEIVFNFDDLGYFVAEAVDGSDYTIVDHGSLPVPYPWLHTTTNDIDGNGKKEFWIGSVDYFNYTGTILYAFEAGSGNNYKPVAKIILQNLVTQIGPMYLTAVDIDNDNVEELVISVGSQLIILSFDGTANHHSYKVEFFKKSQNWIYPCSFYDMNNDGYQDILVPESSEIMTYIYTQNDLTRITEQSCNAVNNFHLFQNYPNPFNPVTTITYSIPAAGGSFTEFVQLKVFNILGEEVATLVKAEKPAGTYKINFDCSNLPGGVYIYWLSAGGLQSARKLILLK